MVGTGNYLIEDYCFAKAEIHSTIATQFKILSILVTASSAVFALLFESGHLPLVICGCLIIPGIYAFFGVLWLDQVYRQRRLATYVLTIEASSEFKDCMLECGISRGWETFIQARKKQEHKHGHKFIKNVVPFLHKEKYACSSIIPSRFYYYVCLALFYFFPLGTSVLSIAFNNIAVCSAPTLEKVVILIWGMLYICFIISSVIYITAICKIGIGESNKDHPPSGDSFDGHVESTFEDKETTMV